MPKAADITASLERTFARIEAERMRDVPILNPRLAVEAVGFRAWQGHWLGVLVTPWFINVILKPGSEAMATDWAGLTPGASVQHRFPAGDFPFLVGEETGIGRYQMCSLFSPVLEFEDQAAARIAAEAALAALLNPPADASGERPDAEPPSPPGGDDNTAIDPEQDARRPDLQVSRRGFLSGRVSARGDNAGLRNKETN
jgi:[NiFe] hydrogenase assembly HybE family chaperone